MPAKRSPADALDASFRRLKLALPANFVADSTRGEHENLQRVFDETSDDPRRAYLAAAPAAGCVYAATR